MTSPAPAANLLQQRMALWWPLALLAIVAPTLLAAHDPPSVTFYNQALAVFGWGLFIASLAWMRRPERLPKPGLGTTALLTLLIWHASMAAWSGLVGHLAGGLAMMGAGQSLAAALAVFAGWYGGRGLDRTRVADMFFGALAVAGGVGMVIAAIQVFHPQWADGLVIASPVVAGRAVGNLRQPNHFSTLLVWSATGVAWLGVRRKLPPALAAACIAALIGGVVWTASRTGMVGTAFLCIWGLLDRRMPRVLRWTLVAAPGIYGAWWGGMDALASLDDVAFAAKERLHDGSDISSSRFAIWANVIEMIKAQPWLGVGYGEFNVAWTFTPFPKRPVAFFDHTHDIVLQWAVEFGIPRAALMLTLALVAYVSLLSGMKALSANGEEAEANKTLASATAVLVALAGLHSLLEYPLWYSYFLLPAAFAWGLGLGSREQDQSATSSLATEMDARPFWRPLQVAGLVMSAAAIWCAIDYQSAVNIYAPRAGAGPLAERIAHGQRMPWFGYQADYAFVTGPDQDDPSKPPIDFRRTLHNLVDSRLMMAYARSLAEHGEVDKARYVVERLKEFHNASTKAFFARCDDNAKEDDDEDDDAETEPPFQCQPPSRVYNWREILPD